MATATGTATSPQDLFDKLIAFLKTNAALVAAGEQWQNAWVGTNDIVLRGPGLSNQDQVFVGLRLVEKPDQDAYWIELYGMTGVLSGGASSSEHVNVSPAAVRMFVDTDSMQYWFVANGRRFIAVVKISTVFQACYAGLFIPYATPISYPYPLFIGGSTGPEDPDGPVNWRSTDDNHSHFASPVYSTGLGAVEASAWMLDPIGQWLRCSNRIADGNVALDPEYAFAPLGTTSRYGQNYIRTRMRECFGGDYPALPITLVQRLPTDQTFGILDGCYRVQGHNNSAENIITIDGVPHLTVQNVYRTTIGEFWALKLA